MWNTIIQFSAMLMTFLLVNWFAYLITEKWGLPGFLNYKPFNCRLCLTFWTTIAVAILYLFFNMTITAAGLGILAVLNALAMYINQRYNTVDVNNYTIEKDKE